MRGRKPKPTWLKLVAGNPGHRPINEAEPQPQGDLNEAPEWMNPEQRAVWNLAIKQAPPGLLRELDGSVLEIWVVAKVMHRDASQRVAKTGTVVRAPESGYPMQNPWVAIINKQAQIMLKAASEMGFTPSARSRVRIERKPGAGTGREFDDLPSLNDV